MKSLKTKMKNLHQLPFTGEDSKTNEIIIHRIDDNLVKLVQSKSAKPHRNNYQAIIWINTGSGRHLIDDKIHKIEPGTFMLITKGQIHSFNPEVGTTGYAIRFSDSFLGYPAYRSIYKYRLFNNITVNSVLKVPKSEKQSFETLILQLLNEFEREYDSGKFDIIRHLLEALIIKLGQLKQRKFTWQYETNNATYLIFQNFNLDLEKHFKLNHNITRYSNRLNISNRKLAEVLKLFLGKTTLEVIQERIITEAKRVLLHSDKTIREVAFELGFKDPYYFSKVFKKITVQSPKAFRDSLQKFT
jgi:AraC-like DNA-binding protein/mannose-6-phosphate isomerase-like protein (cupin superfamily)